MVSIQKMSESMLGSLKMRDDFFDYLDHSAIFTAERNGQTIIFIRFRPGTIWLHPEIQAYALEWDRILVYPSRERFWKLIVVISTKT